MMIDSFTPFSSLLGGALIGVAASMLLLGAGRVAGISGIVGGLFSSDGHDADWRIAFVVGLLVAGVGAAALVPEAIGPAVVQGFVPAAVAGVLVGVGTQLGNGCTSGHGVCGLSRLSARSAVAVAAFMTTGALAVWVVRAIGGGT